MAIDFPVGTRLTVYGRTLEVAVDAPHSTCLNCALRQHSADDKYQGGVVLGSDYSMNASLCEFLQCLALRRTDGRAVYWKLVEGSV